MNAPERVTAAGALLGEAPVWDADTRRLLWVDLWGGLLHATSPGGETTSVDLGAPLSSVVLTERRTRVVTAGLRVLELTGGDGVRHLADIPEEPCMRANDAAVDPAGRLWIGTMTMPCHPARPGGLWRLDPEGPVRVLDDVRLANGLAWSPSGDTLYFTDSLRRRVDAYPYDPADGTIGAARPFCRIAEEDGLPDGIAVDADGGVWVALAGGGTVRRYGPSGRLAEHVRLPTRYPTSCAFGGTGLRDLFITTGSRPVPPPERPDQVARGAGALFRLRTGVRGLPATPMAI
jgi:sugar lactone lactonase YvrE